MKSPQPSVRWPALLVSLSILPFCQADSFYAARDGLTLWGYSFPGQDLDRIPEGLTNVVAIAAGDLHALALKADGTVVAWGWNASAQCNVPGTARNIVAIAAGGEQCLALKADGTLVRWGYNGYNLHPIPTGIPVVKAISAGYSHCLALLTDGTVFAWGGRTNGSGSYPLIDVPGNIPGVTAIAAGGNHSVALHHDPLTGAPGNLADWGSWHDLWNVESAAYPRNCTAIAAGQSITVAVQADGTVLTGGNNLMVRHLIPPAGLTGVTSVATSGETGVLALKSDGTLVWWGRDDVYEEFRMLFIGADRVNAARLNRVTKISVGMDFCMALVQPPLPEKAHGAMNEAFAMAFPLRLAVPRFTATGLPPGLRIHATTGVISGTPLARGTWQATIHTENITQTLDSALTVIIESPVYAAWRASYWPQASADSAWTADPDNDGRPNGVEYALGTAPDRADPSAVRTVELDDTQRLILTIEVPLERASLVQWTAEFATQFPMLSPQEASAAVEEGAPAGFIRYRFTDPRLSSPTERRFGRLKVTLP